MCCDDWKYLQLKVIIYHIDKWTERLIGLPCPSFPPWPQLQEKGGGAIIPCDYFIQCTSNLVEYVKKELKSAVGKMKEKDAMSIQ